MINLAHRQHLAYENSEMMHSYITDNYSEYILVQGKKSVLISLINSIIKRKKIILKYCSTTTMVLLDDFRE